METIAEEINEAVMAQEILRVVDETKSDIRLITRGDFNFLLYHKPSLNRVREHYFHASQSQRFLDNTGAFEQYPNEMV